MLRTFRHALVAAALAVAALSYTATAAGTGELCSLVPGSYAAAKTAHPDAAFAIAEVEKHAIATWYSDRNGDYGATLRQLVNHCASDSRLSLVVYGLPNKDCEAGYSAGGGTVKTAADYLAFLQQLTSTVGKRKALYVLEPDAVGLLAKQGGCGETAGYRANLKTAIKELSANPNAEIYLDIGYWTLQYPDSLSRVVAVVKELATAGTIKGITINTSNYRATSEMATLCTNFQQAMGSTAYKCIVDTSRNYNDPTSTEWCNVRGAGIGHTPTADTGFANLDYFLWIKPPGESDGTCNGGDHKGDAMQGPDAGAFFADAFKLLWNQGYFVKTLGQAAIGAGGGSGGNNNSSTASPTSKPKPTTAAPADPTPTPTVVTTAPTHKPTTAPTTAPPTTTEPPTTQSPVQTPKHTTAAPATQSPVQIPKHTTAAPGTSAPTPAPSKKKKCSVRRARRT